MVYPSHEECFADSAMILLSMILSIPQSAFRNLQSVFRRLVSITRVRECREGVHVLVVGGGSAGGNILGPLSPSSARRPPQGHWRANGRDTDHTINEPQNVK